MLMNSASPNRFPKNVSVQAVIIPELELSDIQREIFGGNLVECADNAAFENRPEAFNGLGMNRATDVLSNVMVDSFVRELAIQMFVANQLIRAKQANLCRNAFANERFKRCGANVSNHSCHYVAFAAHGTRDNRLTGAASRTAAAALIPMAVLGETAHKSFIDFHNAHQLTKILVRQPRPDPVAHMPSGAIRAEAHRAVNLVCRNALFAGQHCVDDTKPHTKADIRILKHRADQNGKAIRDTLSAVHTLPFERHGLERKHVVRATARARHGHGPAMPAQIGHTGFVRRKGLFPLRDRHLVNVLGGSHDSLPI